MASLSDTSEAELALREGEYFHDRYVNLRERPDFERSREAYMRAFELDRNLADAPAGLAYLYGLAAEAGVMPLDEATENMEQWGQTAYEINPRNAMALTVLSQVQHMYPDPNLRTAVEYGLRAVRYDPQHWGGYAALAHGLMSYKLGSAVFAEASARDPLDLFSSTVVGLNAYFLGELDRGLELNDLTLEIDPDMNLGAVGESSDLERPGTIGGGSGDPRPGQVGCLEWAVWAPSSRARRTRGSAGGK